MHKSQSLFYLTTALHVSGVTITHLQEHKIPVTAASCNRYTVLLSAAIVEELNIKHGITFYKVTPRIRKGTNLSDESVPLITFLYEYKAHTNYVLFESNNFTNVRYSDLTSGHSPLAVSEITLLLRLRPGRASFGGIIAEMK
jgi:hypothetical protein